MMRHNNNPKRLHPTRWLLAMAALVMLPGMAAAQSLDAYGETTGSLEGMDSCLGLDEQHALPDLPDDEIYAAAEGSIPGVVQARGEVSSIANTVSVPQLGAGAGADIATDYTNTQLGASASENGIQADACMGIDTPDVPEPSLGIVAQVSSHFHQASASAQAAVSSSFEAASDFFQDVYLTLQAQVHAEF